MTSPNPNDKISEQASSAALGEETQYFSDDKPSVPSIALTGGGDASGDQQTIDIGSSTGRVVKGNRVRVIDQYTLVKILGEGGMGQVWLAEQELPVRRNVALKLIKSGVDSRAIIARFDIERQALALMDHPSIAKIFDGGMTPTGQPYFVMELVNGLSITDFCKKNSLTLRATLQLFLQVCEAIQHAHQKGIVHRDLKPSNILVAQYGDKIVPKIIDFGLAKALTQEARISDQSMLTEYGAILGTLQYMSPEQAVAANGDIDTRADIYALGVLLYELLTGTTPLQNESLKQKSLMAVLEAIRDEEPPRPSDRMSHLKSSFVQDKSKTSSRKSMVSSSIRGDLDWIVMKAIEKNRVRRYETANAFALDIERYLNDQPIAARPPSARYRIGKFVRKHRGAVTASICMLVLLMGGLVGTSLGLLKAIRQTQIAVDASEASRQSMKRALDSEETAKQALKAANLAKDQAQASFDTLLDSIRSADPDQPANARSVIDVLRATRDSIEQRDFPPAVRQSITLSLAETFLSLGLGKETLDTLSKVGSVVEKSRLEPNDLIRRDYLQAMALAELGKYEESLQQINILTNKSLDSLTPQQQRRIEAARIECLDGSEIVSKDDLNAFATWLKKYYQCDLLLDYRLNWNTGVPINASLASYYPMDSVKLKPEEMIARGEDVIEQIAKQDGYSSREAILVQLRMAAYLQFNGEKELANKMLLRTEQAVRSKYGDNHPRLAQVLWFRSTVGLRPNSVESPIVEAYDISLKNFGESRRTLNIAKTLLLLRGETAGRPSARIKQLVLADLGLSPQSSIDEIQFAIQIQSTAESMQIASDGYQNREAIAEFIEKAKERFKENTKKRKLELGTQALFELPNIEPNQPDVNVSTLFFDVHKVGWGEIVRNKTIDGRPMMVGGRKFTNFLTAHANSRIELNLPSGWSTFSSMYGLPRGVPGSVEFAILGDDVELFHSKIVRTNNLHEVSVDVRGVKRLVLETRNGGDGTNCDHSTWIEPKLFREPQPLVDKSYGGPEPPKSLVAEEIKTWEHFDSLSAKVELNSDGKHISRVTLNIPTSPLVKEDFHTIASARQIQRLVLAHSEIRDDLLSSIRNSQDLQHLNLWNTKISNKGLESLVGLTKLKFLNIGQTQATTDGIVGVDLSQLSDLYLNGTKIGSSRLAVIGKCNKLIRLGLADTDVNDADLESLPEINSLEAMFLDRTKITNRGLLALLKFSKIGYIEVRGTQVDEVACRTFSKKFPNCKIVR